MRNFVKEIMEMKNYYPTDNNEQNLKNLINYELHELEKELRSDGLDEEVIYNLIKETTFEMFEKGNFFSKLISSFKC